MGLFSKKSKNKTKLSALLAELVATFFLTKMVLLTINGNIELATPLAASLTLMLFVYTIGSLSGAHLNPAITIGLLATRKIKSMEAAWYVVAQVIGASLAMLTTALVFGLPEVSTTGIAWQIILGEFIGTFILAWGVYSVASGKAPAAASGITIGGSLLLGIFLASPLSNAVLNPAVALGIGSVSILYVLTPIVASITSMHLYKYIENSKISL